MMDDRLILDHDENNFTQFYFKERNHIVFYLILVDAYSVSFCLSNKRVTTSLNYGF